MKNIKSLSLKKLKYLDKQEALAFVHSKIVRQRIVEILSFFDQFYPEYFHSISNTLIFYLISKNTVGAYINTHQPGFSNKHIILLSSRSLELKANDLRFLIFHELAHFLLKQQHPRKNKNNKGVVNLLEQEANDFADLWLDEFNNPIILK